MEKKFTDEEIMEVVKPYLFEQATPELLESIMNSVVSLIGPGNNVAVVFHDASNSLDIMFDENNGNKRVVTVG